MSPSTKLTAAAATRTHTSPGPGLGAGASTTSRGWPNARQITDRTGSDGPPRRADEGALRRAELVGPDARQEPRDRAGADDAAAGAGHRGGGVFDAQDRGAAQQRNPAAPAPPAQAGEEPPRPDPSGVVDH